jgi:hypothetical protein
MIDMPRDGRQSASTLAWAGMLKRIAWVSTLPFLAPLPGVAEVESRLAEHATVDLVIPIE